MSQDAAGIEIFANLFKAVVDEMASVALDLWAGQRGYAKLQVNLLQL